MGAIGDLVGGVFSTILGIDEPEEAAPPPERFFGIDPNQGDKVAAARASGRNAGKDIRSGLSLGDDIAGPTRGGIKISSRASGQ